MGTMAVGGNPLYFSAMGYALTPIPKMKFGTTAEERKTDGAQEAFIKDVSERVSASRRQVIRLTRVQQAVALGVLFQEKQKEVAAQGHQAQESWAPIFEQAMHQLLPYWKEVGGSIESREAVKFYEKHHDEIPADLADILRGRMLSGSQKEINEWLKPYWEPYQNQLALLNAAYERVSMEHAADPKRDTRPWTRAVVDLGTVYENIRRDVDAAKKYPAPQQKVWLEMLSPLQDQAYDYWRTAIDNDLVPQKVLRDAYKGTTGPRAIEGLKDKFPDSFVSNALHGKLRQRVHHPAKPLPWQNPE